MPTIVLTPSTPVQRCHVWWYSSLASKCFLLDIMFVLCAIFQDESSGAGACSWDQRGLPGADWAPRSWLGSQELILREFLLTNWLYQWKSGLGGGFTQRFFSNFHPENWGRWTHFDVHIFQMGGLKPPTRGIISPQNHMFFFNILFWQDWYRYQILPPDLTWALTQFHEILQILPVIFGFEKTIEKLQDPQDSHLAFTTSSDFSLVWKLRTS